MLKNVLTEGLPPNFQEWLVVSFVIGAGTVFLFILYIKSVNIEVQTSETIYISDIPVRKSKTD